MGATVSIGGTACSGVTFVSATSITCIAPAKLGGSFPVVVTNPDSGFSAATSVIVKYNSGTPPTVTSVSPVVQTKSLLGGDTLIITGTLFATGTTASIGGTTCTSVTYLSAASITCIAPAKPAGSYRVIVTNLDSGYSVAENVIVTYQSANTSKISTGFLCTGGNGDASRTDYGTCATYEYDTGYTGTLNTTPKCTTQGDPWDFTKPCTANGARRLQSVAGPANTSKAPAGTTCKVGGASTSASGTCSIPTCAANFTGTPTLFVCSSNDSTWNFTKPCAGDFRPTVTSVSPISQSKHLLGGDILTITGTLFNDDGVEG
eukprot:gene22660-29810_t